jgi:hypothetical protein
VTSLTRHATQIPCASLPIKLHPLPNSAKGSLVSMFFTFLEAICFLLCNRFPCQVQLSQATELISQSLVPRGRADLSTVIAFVNKNIYPPAQDLSAKARDFAWFALRPVSGAHVRFASAASSRERNFPVLLTAFAGAVHG